MKCLLGALMVTALTGCGTKQAEPQPSPSAETEQPAAEQTEKKTLVVCFSRAGENWEVGVVEKGNTMIAAEYIAQQTGADLFVIEPEKPYPENYMETVNIASEEKSAKASPAIKNTCENWEAYTDIIMGYPIWHGDLPMIMYTFMESYDFTGKTVYPFDTHGGSGLSGTVESIRNTAKGAEVMKGLALSGKSVQNEFDSQKGAIDQWLKDSGLIKAE